MATTEQTEFKKKKLFKVARELNVSTDRVVDFLEEEGYADALSGSGFNASITDEEAYYVLRDEYADDAEAAARVRELRSQSDEGPDRDEVATLDEEAEEEPAPADAVSDEDEAEPSGAEAAPAEEAEAEEAEAPEPAVEDRDGQAGPSAQDAAPADAGDGEAAEPDVEVEATASADASTAEAGADAEAPAETDAKTPDAPAAEEPAETGATETVETEPVESSPDASATDEEVEPAGETPDAAEVSEETPDSSADAESTEATPADGVAEETSPDTADESRAEETDTAPTTDAAADASAADTDAEAAASDATALDESAAPTDEHDGAEAAGGETSDDASTEATDAVAEEGAAEADKTDADETDADETGADEASAASPDASGEDGDDRLAPETRDVDKEDVEALAEADEEEKEETLKANRYRLSGTNVVGKVDLESLQRPKRKRKRKKKDDDSDEKKDKQKKQKKKSKKQKKKKSRKSRKDSGPDEEDVEQTIQETLQELEQGASRARQRRRRRRREKHERERQRRREERAEDEDMVRVTEYVTTGELANLMGVQVNEVISTLFDAGMMVSINQRLDRETIEFVCDEFDMEAQFIDEYTETVFDVEEDDPQDLEPRDPVVTVMGHVDHGKTSLLDYIRSANVVAGEEGGITQHIGAHHVDLMDLDAGVTFLDTPGHEAFTAMRARGAKATDIVILVVAADDSVMPQTVEAINHAQAADVPMVVAINKMDKREADAEKVRAELAEQNVLVEEYGGDVQAAEVSAMTGDGINELLDKVLLQSEIMELKANPNREASGVIIESRLEKGRGNVITVLVQNGTLETGDPFLAGIHSGSVRAMFDERDNRIESVGPSQPALVLGCDGSPEVGDQFVVMDDEGEARDVAQERQRIHREQELRRQSQVSLDQVSRQMAEGEFHELNLIIKADVGGSVEALSDALLKLKTDEVAVNVIHSGVGAITESDVMLARASDAIILGFQVRPTSGAREASQREDVDIRTYSVIYAAIEDVRDALEGLLSPERREETKGRAEVRDIFSVPDVGTVAGCYVNEGTVGRNHKVRLVRDGVVQYEGEISSLKRFEEDVNEVQSGYECGLSIENFDDLKAGDELETYVIVEEARELEV